MSTFHLHVLLDALPLQPRMSLLLLFFFFYALRLLPVKILRLALLLTSFFCLRLPLSLQLSAALGCRTNKAWGLSQGCCVMPGQRLLVPDGSSWILPLRVSLSSDAFSFFFSQIHIICSHFPPFLIRSIAR